MWQDRLPRLKRPTGSTGLVVSFVPKADDAYPKPLSGLVAGPAAWSQELPQAGEMMRRVACHARRIGYDDTAQVCSLALMQSPLARPAAAQVHDSLERSSAHLSIAELHCHECRDEANSDWRDQVLLRSRIDAEGNATRNLSSFPSMSSSSWPIATETSSRSYWWPSLRFDGDTRLDGSAT